MTDRSKKLIEVALPLDEINLACKADKDRKTGTIRNLHKWFAPMPLPAWRALIYAALIDDPEDDESRAKELELIKRLVANGADLPDDAALAEATSNLKRQFPNGLPPVMDPFCGGGSTLIEAQRLGLETFGSDLNPVPVLITKVLTEILPPLQGLSPLHPGEPLSTADRVLDESLTQNWGNLSGLAQDTLHYGEVVAKTAWEIVKDYYHDVEGETPVAWLWARTAPCPNPACAIETVLATTWWVSKKKGELAWIVPSIVDGKVQLEVVSRRQSGEAPESAKAAHGSSFTCLSCKGLLTDKYLQEIGNSRGLGLRMTAVVVEKNGLREYRTASELDIARASSVDASLLQNLADISLGEANQYTSPPRFGIRNQADLYTARQLMTLSAFAHAVGEIYDKVVHDGGSEEWARAVTVLLALAVGKMAQHNSTQCRWMLRNSAQGKAVGAFDRGDYPMMWDFAETFFAGGSVGDWKLMLSSELRSLKYTARGSGVVAKTDARDAKLQSPGLIATDPPYFDAIAYADLSDFFYVWHRLALRHIFPELYSTMAAPRLGELTAFPWHHDGTKDGARQYFISGFTDTFRNLRASMGQDLPLLVVYASKEQRTSGGDESRWSSILTAMFNAELQITGTWPIHGTGTARMRGIGSNAVATYVVMISRPRSEDAGTCSLQDFNRLIRRVLKPAVHELQSAGILPVDLSQAAIGPGMQVYSSFRRVLDQSGNQVSVDTALKLINQALSEVLDEQQGELDSASRFALTWWETHHWGEAPFGEADQLARPQGLSVDEVVRSGVAAYPSGGKVALLGLSALDRAWSPSRDSRPTAWEAVHHLADRLINGGGISEASRLMAQLGVIRDQAQSLVYRLHEIAARRGWTEDQERYNDLIASWSDLIAEAGRTTESTNTLF